MQFDKLNPNDCAKEPHIYTHAPDAIRYFVAGRPWPAIPPALWDEEGPPQYEEQVEGFLQYGG